MKPIISSHSQFDDDRYWRFARSSGLPLNYFRRWSVDGWVVACIVALAVLAFVVCGRPL